MGNLFIGEVGSWNNIKIVAAEKLNDASKVTDGFQRVVFAAASVMVFALSCFMAVIGASVNALAIIAPLILFWFLERQIQRREVQRFADLLLEEEEDEFQWSSSQLRGLHSSQLAANLFASNVLKTMEKQSKFMRRISGITSAMRGKP